MLFNYSCQSAYPQLCQSFETSLNHTTYAATEITGVSGPSITLQLISIYKNGTGRQTGGLVNVQTGASNITAFSLVANDYFVLAGGLRAHYQIWNTPSAPTINKTLSEMVAGSLRNVNLLNYTLPGSFMGVTYSQSLGFAFDQSSGLLIELKSSLRTTTVGILSLDFTIVMVDNNVWGAAHMPDFGLSAAPSTINVTGNSTVNSTITLHRLYGFSATVSLSAISSASSLSCSLSPTELSTGGSDASKLSCNGSPGTYTVTVDGNGGYSTHSTPITIIVNAGPIPSQAASNLPTPLIYGGIGAVAIVAGLFAVLLLRRKPSEISIAG